MTDYLARLDAAAPAEKWKLARGFLFDEPLPFFAQMRAERPVYVTDDVTLVFRFDDCTKVLRRPETFGVDLYKPKQGGYFMAQDDTAGHWREKSIMKAILDIEDVPKIRDWVRNTTDAILDDAGGRIEMVRGLSRGVPVKLVQDWFGFTRSDPDKLIDWSYWNQQDAFWNQPFDHVVEGLDQAGIVKNREQANVMMAIYLGRLVLRRSAAVRFGSRKDDPVSRLLRLSFSDGVDFGVKDVVFNVGGLLIGAVETTSHTVCNALQVLTADPDLHRRARDAALGGRAEDFDGYVWEALRYKPAFPYFFRTCHRDTPMAMGTAQETLVRKGTTVLAVTHSAMFDAAAFPDPHGFLSDRDFSDTFTFGQGLHSCLGRHISGVMVPEIVRQILRRPDLAVGAGPDYDGTSVPQSWQISYDSGAGN
ncbi:cytochrome P450 [Thalassococcus sp. BH17M4-6]|uniref:cytochrome P450 n=1 Tax=Thalassococcus sp. BH17M4-6 TaxID=3413148 RepID=UPI003BC81D97